MNNNSTKKEVKKGMAPIEIKLKKEWLQSAYSVYVVVIRHAAKVYLYIGQTGDNYHEVARGPLYRIGGHLTKSSSTENQIVKGFRKYIVKGKTDNHELLEQALLQADISYYFWPVTEFKFNPSEEEHKRRRKETQMIEHSLIWHWQSSNKVIVFNKKVKGQISASNKDFFSDKERTKLYPLSNEIIQYINEEVI